MYSLECTCLSGPFRGMVSYAKENGKKLVFPSVTEAQKWIDDNREWEAKHGFRPVASYVIRKN